MKDKKILLINAFKMKLRKKVCYHKWTNFLMMNWDLQWLNKKKFNKLLKSIYRIINNLSILIRIYSLLILMEKEQNKLLSIKNKFKLQNKLLIIIKNKIKFKIL